MTNYSPLPEWHKQYATLLVWPHQHSDWHNSLSQIEPTYQVLTKVIAARQKVIIICFDLEHQLHVTKQCEKHDCNMDRIEFQLIATNDVWVRDFGPQFLGNASENLYLDFTFNAWGEKYPHQLDQVFAERLFQAMNFKHCQHKKIELILEGGNIDIDEDRNLLTNISCLQHNNPTLSQEKLIQNVRESFNANEILTIAAPALEGDDTRGHIDTLARFINNQTIMITECNDHTHPNYATLQLVEKQIHHSANKSKKNYNIITVPAPRRILRDTQGNILPASYINFLFVNNSILVPLYNDENDLKVLEQFKQICPQREVIGIDATELIQQFGSLHCATLEIPENIF